MKHVILGLFLFLIGAPILAQAQWAVHDAPATAQGVINSARQVAQQVQIYERQFEQLRAAWTQIEHQVKQVEAAYQNLKRIPDGLNFVDLISLKGNELTRLLNATEGLSFTLNTAVRQFEDTYTQLVCTSTTPEIQAAYDKMYKLQMGTAKNAVQLQSIQENLVDAFNRLCALVSGTVQAQGNLDIQQMQAQQAALAAQQNARADAARAAAERVQALRDAERLVKAEMTRCQQDRFFATGPVPLYVADPRLATLHTFTWEGTR
jgi:P-type conjugative transfer protein TrbJ